MSITDAAWSARPILPGGRGKESESRRERLGSRTQRQDREGADSEASGHGRASEGALTEP